jgi:hypothetical protein
MNVLGSALLAIADQAGRAVLTFTEGLAQDEFLRSRLTRAEVLRHTRLLASAAAGLPAALREQMPEIDWAGWAALPRRLQAVPVPADSGAGPATDEPGEALWFAVQSLVPATLLWLQVYREHEPRLFQMGADPAE